MRRRLLLTPVEEMEGVLYRGTDEWGNEWRRFRSESAVKCSNCGALVRVGWTCNGRIPTCRKCIRVEVQS